MAKPTTAPVTDHAVIRYLERCKGVDIEAIRAHIWKTCEAAVLIGARSLRAEGVKFEFDHNTVVTVVPNTPLPNQTSQARSRQRLTRAFE